LLPTALAEMWWHVIKLGHCVVILNRTESINYSSSSDLKGLYYSSDKFWNKFKISNIGNYLCLAKSTRSKNLMQNIKKKKHKKVIAKIDALWDLFVWLRIKKIFISIRNRVASTTMLRESMVREKFNVLEWELRLPVRSFMLM